MPPAGEGALFLGLLIPACAAYSGKEEDATYVPARNSLLGCLGCMGQGFFSIAQRLHSDHVDSTEMRAYSAPWTEELLSWHTPVGKL